MQRNTKDNKGNKKGLKRNNNIRTILFFLVPIILGIVIGKIAYAINQEIIIRVLITLSDNIIVILKFIIPFLVLCLVTTAICEIKGSKIKKIKTLLSLFKVIFLTLIPLTLIVFLISQILVPYLSFDVINETSPWVEPLFKLPFKPLFSSFLGIVLGAILGIIINETSINKDSISKDFRNIFQKLSNKETFETKSYNVFDFFSNVIYKTLKLIQKWIYTFFKYILKPIMPLWILGSFALTSYSGSGVEFFLTDTLLSILILVLQFSWLFTMYYIASKKINKPFKRIVKAGMEIYGYVVSLSGNGSGIILPFIIEREERLKMDKQKAKLVTATSFNMPGSLISDIVFVTGVMCMTGFTLSFLLTLKLMFVLMLVTIIAPAVPMGPASIVATVLPHYGFSDSMIQLYTSMYYKQGISNAATNDASDLYITPFV